MGRRLRRPIFYRHMVLVCKMKKIIITGAAGKTGLSIIRGLADQHFEVTAVIHRQNQAEIVFKAGAVHSVLADYFDIETLRAAFMGKDAIYHICPNMSPDELKIGMEMIKRCQEAGVSQFVYHSVLHPHASKMAHHWQKLLVEEKLFESGLNYTILQPTAYMQNILGYAASINQGIYPMPYPVTSRLSLLDLADLAEAAVQIFKSDRYNHATYELVGTPPLSQVEVAEAISIATGGSVRAVEVPLSEWEDKARASEMAEYTRTTLKSMFEYYRDFGLSGNPNTLSWLLGRAPTTLSQFLTREFNSSKD
jgi:uncharacterized protein YbjT (DUF2867 family)